MIESVILRGLVNNEDYMRKVIPFLKDQYFSDPSDKTLFNEIFTHINKYNRPPSKEALQIAVGERDDINEQIFNSARQTIDEIYEGEPDQSEDWLVDKTEEFCQDKAIVNAVRESILIIDGKDSTKDRGSIPQLLSDALAVGFDPNVGHDYLEDALERYEFYHRKESKISFDLEYFNKITKGGVSRKALIVVLAGTGVGKTLLMCHCAAANLMDGLNVLYVTAEMAEEMISERIDANLLDVTVDYLRMMSKDTFQKRIESVKNRTTGKLIVKEYPTATVNSNHIRFLLNELKMKSNFVPDILYVDYLNICASSRMKPGANVNSYTYIKAIAEEMRGLGVEFNIPVFTATQVNRTGFTSSDFGLEDTSESFGLPATADFMFGMISSEELENLGQIMIKQLKNRWGDINSPKRFVVGIDRPKMRLYNLEQAAQDDVVDDSPKPNPNAVMDNTDVGHRLDDFSRSKKKPVIKDFR